MVVSVVGWEIKCCISQLCKKPVQSAPHPLAHTAHSRQLADQAPRTTPGPWALSSHFCQLSQW